VDKVKVNGKELTKKQFEQKKANLSKKKGVSLEEVFPNDYRIKIKG